MANSRGGGDDPESTPICRCRVLYLGSAVPHVTKDGLQGIQEPLRELYPEQGALGARGIDSWLSVWSNGLLLENVDENHKKVTRFFPIDSLHYCAAVRYVLVPERAGVALGGAGGGGTLLSTSSGSGGGPSPRFLPLDSPFARTPNPSHPPLFAAILRRTTGIKVLECHAFICKREMAANALVRCCFHAYADSSYARHMDGSGGGSAYGTLRSTVQGGEPAPVGGGGGGGGGGDSWRRSALSLNHHSASAGGTLTSNASAASALSAATDDVSIYNGDENHKVWVGSGTLEREEVYGGGGGSSTVRSSRSQRPRQVVAPVSAPPPPPTPKEEKAAKKAAAAAKERGRRKKLLGGSVDNLMMLNGMSGGGSLLRPHSSMSGAHHHHHQGQPQPHQHRFANGGGSLLRHANGYHHPHSHPHPHPHHYAPAGPPPGPPMVLATLPSRPKQAKAKAGGGKVLLAPVPVLAPVPPHHPGTGRRRHHAPMVVPVEEPVYMPSARPMSPVASFQPGHFPHEAYLMQQYATVEHPGRHAKKKAAKHKGGGAVMAPPPAVVPVPVPVPVQPPPPHVLVNGGGASPDEDELAAEESTSPFNTGIYRKKGHLNERAFSYSIRQEHRSRSYGSLANLKFSGPDLKKEREIAQMMHDLELSSGDELERSEVAPVPPATHQHQRGSLRTANVRR